MDGGKKIKGRKRHLAVDSMGNHLFVIARAANIHDTKSVNWPAGKALAIYPVIQKFCADAGYSGTFAGAMKEKSKMDAGVIKRSQSRSRRILPKLWIVERNFVWLNTYRGFSKDYEINVIYSVSMINIAASNILLKRL